MKRKIIALSLRDAPSIHPLSGQTTFNGEKQLGIEMYTGIEPGVVTVFLNGIESAIPIANCKAWVWEKMGATKKE